MDRKNRFHASISPQKNEEMNILVIVVSMLGQKQQGFYNDTQPI
jgi:hypothetical protein